MSIVYNCWKRAKHMIAGFCAAAAIGAAGTASAVTPVAQRAPVSPDVPYVVRTDFGGAVVDRLYDIQVLRASGRQVEIRGAACLSSCTMLLSLETTCVHPGTVFGFHGPSRGGVPLDRALFDRVSMVIAMHYPPQLRLWYMSIARHSLRDMHHLTGQQLIALGVSKPCRTNDYASTTVQHQLRSAG